MKNKLTWVTLTLLIAVLASIITFQLTYLSLHDRIREAENSLPQTGLTDSSASADSELMQRIINKLTTLNTYYQGMYVHDIDEETLLNAVADGYVYGTGDKYANYLSADEYKEFMLNNQGTLVGIGVNVIYDNLQGYLEVVTVMPGSPASESGLQNGDLIYMVEGEYISAMGYYAAVNAIKGEEGTKVNIAILRPVGSGEQYEHIDLTMERRAVTIQSVMARLYEKDPTIGIIRITEFDAETPNQFFAELQDLVAKGATRFVFDVRDNPGGELNSILAVLDMLLPEGPLIRIVDRDGNEEVIDSTEIETIMEELNADYTVLVNGSTASAAELFSSAIKDYQKGTLVGVQTYGKGTMQSIFQLGDGSAVTISYRMYNPPYSDNYEGVGVEPDVVVEMADDVKNISLYKITDEQDTQLQKAIEILNTK
ncbi:MAG: PDZ domain-containing protein [Ruminococcaceae bacterium]|nr:PDZ domain-containing protein [Oscillospiraceae bacterium]